MATDLPPSPRSTAPPWDPDHHRFTRLFHGCLRRDTTVMLRSGISHSFGQPDVDFGQGFYTTTLRRQAEDWAYLKHKRESAIHRARPDHMQVVLWFRVARNALAKLECLAFVRGSHSSDEYWSFVQHCRSSIRATRGRDATIHHRVRDDSGRPTWYDMLVGPVAAFWQQRSAMLDADQFSFHTPRATKMLHGVLTRGERGVDRDVNGVPV